MPRRGPAQHDHVVAGVIRTPDQRLRVFISSTLAEVADERRAARAAVEQLRLAPVMFELGARPHPPRALYRSYLAQSDVLSVSTGNAMDGSRPTWRSLASKTSSSCRAACRGSSTSSNRRPTWTRNSPSCSPVSSKLRGSASYKPFRDADELRALLLDDLAILLTERFDGARREPASKAQPRHNLPAQTSTFLGREAELHDLRDVLAAEEVRLVTLTGPGGTGKTRLAIRAAVEQVGRFADGVVFVDLSAEREVEAAFAAVARAADVAVASEARPLAALIRELRDRQVLLVLDTFEHVTPAAVGVVELLEHCPDVKALVTSRQALRVRGERVLMVPPLSLPEPGDAGSVAGSEAVRLF